MSAYSLDLREKIVESVKKGVPKAETARRFRVDRATVKRYCKRLDERGTLEPRKAPGKKPKLDEKARKLLVEDVRGFGERGDGLPRGGSSTQEPNKRTKGAQEQDEFVRSLWRMELGRLEPSRLVFVDEMGTHTSLAPIFAYSPIGERAYFKVPRNRGKNTTLLTSLHAEGMGPSMAVQGATTVRIFETYVERVLAPSLKPGQVVVMDKLGAHRPKRIRELIEERGCELLYLPSYSPDLNSIEEAFSKVKHLLREAPPERDRRSHQGGPDRGDESSTGSREFRRRARVLRSLRLPDAGSIFMVNAVGHSDIRTTFAIYTHATDGPKTPPQRRYKKRSPNRLLTKDFLTGDTMIFRLVRRSSAPRDETAWAAVQAVSSPSDP